MTTSLHASIKKFNGWILLSLLVAIVAAGGMHKASLDHGYEQVSNVAKTEAALIVELTNGFVKEYSNISEGRNEIPDPAQFRVSALRNINLGAHQNSSESVQRKNNFSTEIVGLPGKELNVAAGSDGIRQQLLAMAASPRTDVVAGVFEEGSSITHRSLWAVYASDQTCADCHNLIQNLSGADQWKVGDLMGAQVVERSIKSEILNVQRSAVLQCILLFLAVFVGGLFLIYLTNHFRLTKELKILATTDPLTGCINRREFWDRMGDMENRTNGAVLMLDLDKFKAINDTYGHDVGDQVIRDFTARLKQAVRAGDLVARFGGEEFLIWLPDVKPIDAIRLAERVRDDTESGSVMVDNARIQYTVSIGMHMVENAKSSRFEHWIKAADRLLYRAKSEGRNRIACEIAVGT